MRRNKQAGMLLHSAASAQAACSMHTGSPAAVLMLGARRSAWMSPAQSHLAG
jgi:hypothetical protein